HRTQQLRQAGVPRRHLKVRLALEPRHLADMKAVRLAAALLDAEPLVTQARQPEKSIRQLMKVGDLGARAHLESVDLGASDLAAFADQHHAKALMLAQTPPHHVDVTGFEDSQRQRTAGKQHDVEVKQGERTQVASRKRSAASSLSCRPPKPPLLITSTWSPDRISADKP